MQSRWEKGTTVTLGEGAGVICGTRGLNIALAELVLPTPLPDSLFPGRQGSS